MAILTWILSEVTRDERGIDLTFSEGRGADTKGRTKSVRFNAGAALALAGMLNNAPSMPVDSTARAQIHGTFEVEE